MAMGPTWAEKMKTLRAVMSSLPANSPDWLLEARDGILALIDTNVLLEKQRDVWRVKAENWLERCYKYVYRTLIVRRRLQEQLDQCRRTLGEVLDRHIVFTRGGERKFSEESVEDLIGNLGLTARTEAAGAAPLGDAAAIRVFLGEQILPLLADWDNCVDELRSKTQHAYILLTELLDQGMPQKTGGAT